LAACPAQVTPLLPLWIKARHRFGHFGTRADMMIDPTSLLAYRVLTILPIA
jgi:hypothetical protein